MATRRNTPAEKVEVIYLVIKSNQTCLLRKPRGNAQTVRLAADEVAVRINLVFPRSWASVIGTMDVSVPDFAPTFTWSPDPEDEAKAPDEG